MSRKRKGVVVYDAAAMSNILGLPCECGEPVPVADHNEVVIYYGGWDLPTLRESPAGKERMWQNQRYDMKDVVETQPGYYRLISPVPSSNYKNVNEQVAHHKKIGAGDFAPIAVMCTALLAHLQKTGKDLLKNDLCRCAGIFVDGHRALLAVTEGRVYVNSSYGDGDRAGRVWSSASR